MHQEVWFTIVYEFGLRGKELFGSFIKDLFSFGVNSDGYKEAYIEIRCDLLGKNVKALLTQEEFEILKCQNL